MCSYRYQVDIVVGNKLTNRAIWIAVFHVRYDLETSIFSLRYDFCDCVLTRLFHIF